MKNPTATEALVLLLNDFRERKKKFTAICDYDGSMKQMREKFNQQIETISNPLREVAKKLFEIADQSFFLIQVVEWKIDYLADALIHAIKSENPISLANNARALVEHVATLAGIGSEIDCLEESLKGQQSESKIQKALERATSNLRKAYYGKSPKMSEGKGDKAIHINDSLKILSKDVKNIEELYDFLCEYVHPNYGSNLLVSTGKLAGGSLKPPEEFHRETLDKLRRICSYCMIYLNDEVSGHLASPIRLQALIDRFFVRGVKLQNVFAIKEAKPKGDGKSKLTAYHFPKARTPQEAIQLTSQFLESEGYKLTGKKEVGGIEDGHIFDVHHTSKGKVWVKIPLMKI